jgi:hypothetical protein
MSRIQILLIAWVSLTLVATIAGILSVYKRKKTIVLELPAFMNVSLSSAAIVSSCSLIYRAITLKELETLLQFDIVTLYLGAIAVIWLSIQQIRQVFK